MTEEEKKPGDSSGLDQIFDRIKAELESMKTELKSDFKSELDGIRAEFRIELDSLKEPRHYTTHPPVPPPPPPFAPPVVDIPVTGTNDKENNRRSEEFNFQDFSGIEVVGAFEVEIVQSEAYSVNIYAEDRMFRNIEVSRDGDVLKVRQSRHIGWIAQITSARPRVKITLPVLKRLRLSGASRADIHGFNSPEPFNLDITGASSAAGSIVSGNAEIKLSGASNIRLTGSAKDAIIEASGANHLELRNFPVNNAAIKLSGTSHLSAEVNGRLDARLSGVSHLSLSGNPAMGNIRTSGASQLVKE